MLDELYKFFYTKVFTQFYYSSNINAIFNSTTNPFFGGSISIREYFCFTCTIISLIVIFVLCCLFIFRLIRVVGRLFMGA